MRQPALHFSGVFLSPMESCGPVLLHLAEADALPGYAPYAPVSMPKSSLGVCLLKLLL
jgi:hypothetical protein